jgi:hypothetical protein
LHYIRGCTRPTVGLCSVPNMQNTGMLHCRQSHPPLCRPSSRRHLKLFQCVSVVFLSTRGLSASSRLAVKRNFIITGSCFGTERGGGTGNEACIEVGAVPDICTGPQRSRDLKSPTVRRPVSSMLITFTQLLFFYYGAPSLMRGRICNL